MKKQPGKSLTLRAVGLPVNRSARKQKLELLVDPSPGNFLTHATAGKERVNVVVSRPGWAPIRFSGQPMGLRLKLCNVVMMDPTQIGLIEHYINDDEPDVCGIEITYTPVQDELPWDEDKEVHHGDTEDTENGTADERP